MIYSVGQRGQHQILGIVNEKTMADAVAEAEKVYGRFWDRDLGWIHRTLVVSPGETQG